MSYKYRLIYTPSGKAEIEEINESSLYDSGVDILRRKVKDTWDILADCPGAQSHWTRNLLEMYLLATRLLTEGEVKQVFDGISLTIP